MHKACNPDLAAHTTHRTKPALGSHQSTLRRMCRLYSADLPTQCLVELQFRDRLCIDTRIVQQPIMPGFDGGAHLGHRRVYSHPHSVAARLQICSDNLAPRSPSTHPLQFLLAPRRCLLCASSSLAYAVMMTMAPSCLMKCETENVDSSSVITRPNGLPGLSAILNRSINQQTYGRAIAQVGGVALQVRLVHKA